MSSNAQLIFIDKRNQPIKEYIVAVAASDGLDIKGIQIIASPAKGEKALASATLKIPPLEPLNFKDKKIIEQIMNSLVVGKQTLSIDQFIEKSSEDEEVRKSLRKSVKKIREKLTDLISEFTSSEVINLIQERRNDALFKLKEQDQTFKNKKVLCIDIEATDVSSKDTADIIQISICDFEGNKKYNSMFNPGYEIPENDKHNITTEMVANSPSLEESWEQIHSLLNEADTILAYSTESDFAYLQKSAEKKNLSFELDYNDWHDVAVFAKDLTGALRWQSEKMYWFYKTPKLTDAYEKVLGKTFPGDAHDAMVDAQATVELFQGMLEKGRKTQIVAKKPEPLKSEITNNPFAAAFAQAKRSKKS